jgi:hypothetical protein
MPPESPVLIRPDDQSVVNMETVVFTWHSQIHTSDFSLQVSKEPDFSSRAIDQANIVDSTFSVSGLDNNTTYYWRVFASNVAGESPFSTERSFTLASSSEIDLSVFPDQHELNVHPNPFTNKVNISLIIPETGDIKLVIYNNGGQMVRELISGEISPGSYDLNWNGLNQNGTALPVGVYYFQLRTASNVITQKILKKH